MENKKLVVWDAILIVIAVLMVAGVALKVSYFSALRHQPAPAVKQVVPAVKHGVTPEPGDYPVESSNDPSQTFNEDDLRQAALDHLFPRINPPYPGTASLEEVKQARVRLECARTWAVQLPNRQVSAAYMWWIDFYSTKFDQMETDIRSPKHKAVDPYEEERKARQARIDAIVIPKPPSQICQSTRTEFKGKMGDSK